MQFSHRKHFDFMPRSAVGLPKLHIEPCTGRVKLYKLTHVVTLPQAGGYKSRVTETKHRVGVGQDTDCLPCMRCGFVRVLARRAADAHLSTCSVDEMGGD